MSSSEFSAEECIVIDGDGLILGRLASKVASLSLDQEESVAVINAEGIVVSGEKEDVFQKYRDKMDLGSDRGPYNPRKPDRLAKRSVRGMLPNDKQRGRDAYSRIRFYLGIPKELGDREPETQDQADAEELGRTNLVSLGEISEHLGAEVTWQR